MSHTPPLYRMATRVVRAASPLLGRGASKLAVGLRGRARAHEILSDWGRSGRDEVRPTLWFHAPSVGEGLQARAVIDALRAMRPDAQIVFTHFSPSAAGLAEGMPADASAYLPWDLPDVTGEVLHRVQPDLLAFTRTEVWPTLAGGAADRGVPVCLVAGTLSAEAGRMRWPARTLLRPTWKRMSLVGAVGEADAARFRALGVAPEAVVVTGDPGVDSAARRAEAIDTGQPHLAPFVRESRPTLVAGSTWPSDEEVLESALASVRAAMPRLRVIVAPHEPDPATVAGLAARFGRMGWRTATLADVEAGRVGSDGASGGADAVVVDRVGVLASLYAVADVAYVGGGFHAKGLHSVLEPAACGVPVLFGPAHHKAPAAGELLQAGGARVVEGAPTLARVLQEWLASEDARAAAGRSALGYIDAHRGAAQRTAELLARCLNA